MPHINNFLSRLKGHPFHMPGHKRNTALFPALSAERDITEINGADNLHYPVGIIKNAMDTAASLWGAASSYFLVNGSTCGILAGLATLCKRGDKVLVARNCHRSVFHGLEILGLAPVYILPQYISDLGVYGAMEVNTVATALEAHPDIRTLVITSPTYEGVISDLSAICAICHSRGVTVLVDEAHGAHLDLSPHFVGGSVAAGADISVQSLHKTLPALTQTAILHVNTTAVDAERLMHKLRVFETSSPSYLLMQSAEHSVEAAKDKTMFDRWAALIAEFKQSIACLKHIKLALQDCKHDSSKLVFVGVDGVTLSGFLRQRGIEPELADRTHLIAMTGPGNTKEDFNALAAALKAADALLPPVKSAAVPPPFCHGEAFCGIERALELPSAALPVAECIGRVAAEYVWAYPPGIPILIPGERIKADFAAADLSVLESDSGLLPKAIKVLC